MLKLYTLRDVAKSISYTHTYTHTHTHTSKTHRFKSDPRVWKPYDADVQAQLERAWKFQDEAVMVRIRGNPYELSFRHFQKNDPEIMGIQRSRRGKRAFHFCVPGTDTHLRGGHDAPVVTGTSNSSEKKWCWLASDQYEPEEWQPYPDKLQGYLDRACMSDSMRIRVRIGGRPYIIDLMSRAQISELSGSVRQIKKMVVRSCYFNSISNSSRE